MPSPTEHEARARESVVRALAEIPFYGRRAPKAPILPGDDLGAVLAKLPLLAKRDVRTTLPKQWVAAGRDVKGELASGDLEIVETGGGATERVRILRDKGWWAAQDERAMRTNDRVAGTYDGGSPYKEAVLATPLTGMNTCHAGDLGMAERSRGHRLWLNQRPDPTYWLAEEMDRILDEIVAFGAHGLEADPSYLALLARHATARGRSIDVPGFVSLTYGLVTTADRRAIDRVYAGPVVRKYGSVEAGVLFVEGPDGLLHHAPVTTHVELLPARVPTPGAEGVALIVVTTLDRAAQPLVRYVVGDLGQVARDTSSPTTGVPSLRTVEGRVDDALSLPSGALVTSAAFDRGLAEGLASTDGILVVQANQRTRENVEIDLVLATGTDEPKVLADVRTVAARLLEGVDVTVRRTQAIAAEPGGEFRITKRHFPLDWAASFEGCEGFVP
ncbi:MAG: hypothetical protein U0169_00950 [Polyangiaceae bacterium]